MICGSFKKVQGNDSNALLFELSVENCDIKCNCDTSHFEDFIIGSKLNIEHYSIRYNSIMKGSKLTKDKYKTFRTF